MPNIEIHGGDVVKEHNRAYANEVVLGTIRELFSTAPYKDEVVVTIANDNVTDLSREQRPFLRIVSSVEGQIEDVAKRLRPLNMDIEVLELKQFIPAS